MRVEVFDIDGVLCDNSKGSIITRRGNKAEACLSALPLSAGWRLLRSVPSGVTPVILTAREGETFRTPTLEWLRAHNSPVDDSNVYFRPAQDRRLSSAFKSEWLVKAKAQGWDVIAVYDDEPHVISALSYAGFNAVMLRVSRRQLQSSRVLPGRFL